MVQTFLVPSKSMHALLIQNNHVDFASWNYIFMLCYVMLCHVMLCYVMLGQVSWTCSWHWISCFLYFCGWMTWNTHIPRGSTWIDFTPCSQPCTFITLHFSNMVTAKKNSIAANTVHHNTMTFISDYPDGCSLLYSTRSSSWLAQLVTALATPMHVRSCVLEVRVRFPGADKLDSGFHPFRLVGKMSSSKYV